MVDKKPGVAARKTALVVDDSKLARYVLKEMLVDMGIHVETASSAEEGLGFLSASAPDVIFMDHMMPGMDGFQAVQAIKKDPKTARIPIIMYTSKEGEVYVAQARAFGAVGVLPKKLKPVQLEKVLEQLKLVEPRPAEPIVDNTPNTVTIDEPAEMPKVEHTLEELARSASEELEKDSMRGLFRQLFVEQRDRIKLDQYELLESLASKVTPVVHTATRRALWWILGTITATLIAVMLLLRPVYDALKTVTLELTSANATLSHQTQQLEDLQQQVAQLGMSATSASADTTPAIKVEALEWAINQHSQLPYGIPLNTQENEKYIAQLAEYLSRGGFEGDVLILYHAGEFCEVKNEVGQAVLADPDLPVTGCTLRTFNVSDHEQEGIAEFESYLSTLNKYYPDINIEFEMMGTKYRLKEFPEYTSTTSSGQWNQIAAQNNSLEYLLQQAKNNQELTQVSQ
ncbi:response regulator [Gynuella sp.]|uniref:response regulator n=1 Tax=Gynuella sp. TaxID=2969146 RepID=UPI003D14981D